MGVLRKEVMLVEAMLAALRAPGCTGALVSNAPKGPKGNGIGATGS